MNKKIIITLLALLIVQVIQAQNNAIFFGGSGDGHALGLYAQTINEINRGGEADGWATANFAQAQNNISLGGEGDGWASQGYLQGGDTSMFVGGEGDGWASLNYMQIADSALFRGGEGDGWASVIYQLGPLPVELLNFTGEQKGDYHILHWQTASEINTSHFVIEHSADAKLFRELGMRNAAGNSSVKQSYDFTNTKPLVGDNFYRLKMVDQNGQYKYSNVVLLKVLKDKSSILVYPNPTVSQLNIDILNATNNANIKMRIIDLSGKTVWSSTNKHSGTTYQIDISSFASGMYHLYVETPNDIQVIKFSKK